MVGALYLSLSAEACFGQARLGTGRTSETAEWEVDGGLGWRVMEVVGGWWVGV